MLIPDQLQRDSALDTSKSFIVQAPAGSGKTELLTQRFIRLLSTVNSPEEIIAITFTRKAAIEMKHRIISQLKNIESHRLRIMTIDAFNKFLSEQLPLESKYSENFTISENPEKLYLKAIEKLFSINPNDSYKNHCLEIFLTYLDNDMQRVNTLLLDLLQYRDQWLSHLPRLAHQDAVTTLENAWKNLGFTYTPFQKQFVGILSDVLLFLIIELKTIFNVYQEYDFIEVSLSALESLGEDDSPTDLALKLDYQIKHLLVDEFQDTSVTQWRLLQKIVGGWENQDGKTVFFVGDPMQSIYRFRKAHVGLFLEVQQHGIGNIKPSTITLTSNFRSHQPLVQWFNHTFEAIFPKKSDINLGAISYTPCESVDQNLPAEERKNKMIFYYPIHSEETFSSDHAEANKINDVIISLQSSENNEKIAILARSRNHFNAIIPLLEKNKISYIAHELDSYKNHPLIEDLFSLTRALLHPADRIAWLSVLRTPWCGCDLKTLSFLCENIDSIPLWDLLIKNKNSLDQRMQHFILSMEQALHYQSKLTLRQIIEKTWLNLNGPHCLSSENHVSELEAAEYYFDLLDELNYLNTVELIQELEKKLFTKQTKIKNFTHGHIQVELMTIHKAKGLEFDHVFLPGLEKITRAETSKLFLWEERLNSDSKLDLLVAPIPQKNTKEDIYELLKQSDKKKNEHELLRLLYVAATRAKKSLHLLYSTHIKSPPANSFLNFLWPTLSNKAIFSTKLIKNEKFVCINSLTRLPEKVFSTISTNKNLAPEIDAHPLLESLLYEDDYLSIGTVVHEALYLLSQKITLTESYLKTRLLQLSSSLNNIDKILQCIENVKSDTIGQWILTPHCEAQSEYALSDTHQHIVMDRTFVDEKNTRWIIDYKITPRIERELYQSQLENYAKIFRKIEKRPIKCGLYFPLTKDWINWDYNNFF